MGREMDIHLFLEYTTQDGDDVDGIQIAGSTLGEHESMICLNKGIVDPEPYSNVNRMATALAEGCTLENIRMSVTIFNDNGIYKIRKATNNLELIKGCTDKTTFYWKEINWGIPGGHSDWLFVDRTINEMSDYIMKLKAEAPNRKHVVVMVCGIYPDETFTKRDKEVWNDFCMKCKNKGIEFITLRMKDNAIVKYRCKQMDYDLYKKLSTVPLWTREGDFKDITFLLSIIGKKLNEINRLQKDSGLQEIIRNDCKYQLDSEEKEYYIKRREEDQKEEEDRIQLENWAREARRGDKFAYLSAACAFVGVGLGYGLKMDICNVFFVIGIISGIMGRKACEVGAANMGVAISIMGLILSYFQFFT